MTECTSNKIDAFIQIYGLFDADHKAIGECVPEITIFVSS